MKSGRLDFFDMEMAFVQKMPDDSYITQCDVSVKGRLKSIQLSISQEWMNWIAKNLDMLDAEFSLDLVNKMKVPVDIENWYKKDIGFLDGKSLSLSGKAKVNWDVEYCEDPNDAEFYELVHMDGLGIKM